ncbi:MAG: DUF4304 domain-containing protein [Chitinophagaceae bacterium]|nr:DUF4304 domain-containing protein [Chitinophagaceae bacterium]
MIANQKSLYEFVDRTLKPHGFIKKKDTWYLHTKECICFLVITKSPFAGRYEDLMGAFLKEMNTDGDFPKYEKGHLKYSFKDIIASKKVKQILDLENNQFKGEEREEAIKNILENYAIPFLQKISTKQGIINAINEYEDLIYRVRTSLKERLGIQDEEDD